VDISRLTATVPVGEMEVGMLRKAMNATVRVPAVGNQEFDGTVRAIAAGSDPASGSYPVEVLWRNTPRHSIKSGMSVRVTIHTQSPDSVLLIPAGAVATVEHKDAVFLASASQAAVRFVSLGRTAGNLIEAIEGIHEGDTLVTTGLTALARGRKLKPTVVGSSGGPQ
jgi:RND family efflux transporter MFP subunit